MSLPGPDEFKTGLMTRVHDCLSAAQSSLLKTVWKDPTELKPAGDTSAMVYDLEQELQSISLRLEALALITGTDSLRVARVHLEKSIAALTSSYAEAEYTKTEQ
jgi:hypothetical protein